jgi:hypothetical protein
VERLARGPPRSFEENERLKGEATGKRKAEELIGGGHLKGKGKGRIEDQ